MMNRTLILNLLWKEWREHQWRLIAGCGVMGVLGAIQFPGNPRHVDSAFGMALWASAIVFPMFICMAMGTERASGSLQMLLNQPAPPWIVLASKTITGLIASIGPVLTVGLLAWFLIDAKIADRLHIWLATSGACMLSAFAFIWMLSLSVRCNNETSVGLTCIALLVAIPTSISIFATFVYQTADNPTTAEWVVGLVTAAVILLATPFLWFDGARRLALPLRVRERHDSGHASSVPGELKRYSFASSPYRALRWKEWRLNRWWGLAMVIFALMPPVAFIIDLATGDQDWIRWSLWGIFASPLIAVLIVATGLGRELNPAVFDLLRSRAISESQWFWAKWGHSLKVFGLAFLAFVILEFLFAYFLFIYLDHLNYHQYGGTLEWTVFLPVIYGMAIYSCGVVLTYCATFMITCAVRQPVYAGILSLGFSLMIFLMPSAYVWDQRLRYFVEELTEPYVGTPTAILIQIGVTFAASLAILMLAAAFVLIARWIVRRQWEGRM